MRNRIVHIGPKKKRFLFLKGEIGSKIKGDILSSGKHLSKSEVNGDIAFLNSLMKSAREEKDYLKSILEYPKHMAGTLGRSRDSMPQVKKGDVDEIILHFTNNGVKVKKLELGLSQMTPAQGEINDDKIINELNSGKGFVPKRKYIISKDKKNYFIDGTHNWAKGFERKDWMDIDVVCYRVDLNIKELLRRLNLLKKTQKKDLSDSIIKSFLFDGFGLIMKAGGTETAPKKPAGNTWSQRLVRDNWPARWVTYRGHKLLIKTNSDGTGTVVFSADPSFEHLRIIPKSHPEYEKLKKKSEKRKKDKAGRESDNFTEAEMKRSKETAKLKKKEKSELKNSYLKKLIKISEIDSSPEELASPLRRSIESKAERKIGKEVTLAEVMDDIKDLPSRDQKAVSDILEDKAMGELVDETLEDTFGHTKEKEIVIDTGNKNIDKKLKRLKLTTEQALAIQDARLKFRRGNKDINEKYKDEIVKRQSNLEVTSMQGIGVMDFDSPPGNVDELIADAIKGREAKARAKLNTEFYALIEGGKGGVDKKSILGAQDTVNALSGLYLKGSGLSKESIEFLGIENSAKVVAGALASVGKSKKAKREIETYLKLKSTDLVKDSLEKAKEKFERINSYRKQGEEGILASRTAAINIARQYGGIGQELGSAVGSLQAAATVLDSLRDVDESASDIVIDGGKNIYNLKEKMERMGLKSDEYSIKRNGARLKLTIPFENYSKLLSGSNESYSRNKEIEKLKDKTYTEGKVINEKLGLTDWLPDGQPKTFWDFRNKPKEGYEAYKNKKGESGYTSEYPLGEKLYRKEMQSGSKPQQERMIKFINLQERGVWNGSAGLGKTLAFLGTISHLKSNGKLDSFAFHSPPSRLVGEMFKDQEKFFPNMKVVNLDKVKGMKNKRKVLQDAKDGKWDVVVSGHDSVKSGLSAKQIDKYVASEVANWKAKLVSEGESFGTKSLKDKLAELKKKARYSTGLPSVIAEYKPSFVSVDEAHEVFKDERLKESQKFAAIKTIAKGAKYFVPATGTVIRNSVGELATLCNITRPDLMPNPKKFSKKWDKINQGTSLMQGPAVDSFRKEFDDIIITEKNKLDSELHENTQKIELSAKQKELYKKSESMYRLDRKATGFGIIDKGTGKHVMNGDSLKTFADIGIQVSGKNSAKALESQTAKNFLKKNGFDPSKHVLTKLGIGASSRRDSRHDKILHNGDHETNAKIQAMLKNFDNHTAKGRDKHIVFASRKDSLSTITEGFKSRGIKEGQMAFLDGSLSAAQRKKAVTKFQTDPNIKVFIMSEAGMTGINVQAADVIHHVGRVNTAALQDQANARSHRTGRNGDVHSHYYDSGTAFDNNRVDNLSRKAKLMAAVGDYDPQSDLKSKIAEIKRRKNIKKSEKTYVFIN